MRSTDGLEYEEPVDACEESNILIRCTSPLLMMRCQHMASALHTLLVSQVESELVLSVELVSALIL